MPRVVFGLFIATLLTVLGLGGYYFYLQVAPQIKVVNNIKEVAINIDRTGLNKLWKETGFLKAGKLAYNPNSDEEFKADNIIVEFSYGDLKSSMIWHIIYKDKLAYGFNTKRAGNNYLLSIFLGQDWFASVLEEEGAPQAVSGIIAQSSLFIGRLHEVRGKITEVNDLNKVYENLENLVKKYPVADVKKI